MLKGIGSRDTAELYTDVVGAAKLAAFLNDLPHLRSAFFATIAYQDWGRALEAHRRQSIPIDPTSALPPLIGVIVVSVSFAIWWILPPCERSSLRGHT